MTYLMQSAKCILVTSFFILISSCGLKYKATDGNVREGGWLRMFESYNGFKSTSDEILWYSRDFRNSSKTFNGRMDCFFVITGDSILISLSINEKKIKEESFLVTENYGNLFKYFYLHENDFQKELEWVECYRSHGLSTDVFSWSINRIEEHYSLYDCSRSNLRITYLNSWFDSIESELFRFY